MLADGRIHITISQEPIQTTPTPSPEPTPSPNPTPNDKEKEDKGTLSYAQMQLFNFAKSQAKQMVNYTLGNIGNFTGDFYMQRSINNNIQVGSTLLNIGNAVYHGGKIGGISGAGVGLLVATSSVAINMVLGDISKMAENNKQNKDIEMLRNLSGLNTLTNGSR